MVTEKDVNLFFVAYMPRDETEVGTMLIRSLSGSPLRTMVHCAKDSASDPVLVSAVEHMMKALVAASP